MYAELSDEEIDYIIVALMEFVDAFAPSTPSKF